MDEQQDQGGKPKKSLDDLTGQASEELIRIKTIFPFTIIPTEIVVDQLKIVIITRWFFYRHYFPILIKDIKTVTVSHNLLFAALNFEMAGHESNPAVVGYLKKNQAIKAHQIILGLMAVNKEKAEESMKDVPGKKLSEKLTDIGSTSASPDVKDTKVKG